jgi:hypothetical protein
VAEDDRLSWEHPAIDRVIPMTHYILTRIDTLQQELETLKRMLISQDQSDRPRVRLKGIWKGAEISNDLLEEAKQSIVSKDLNKQGNQSS